MRPDLVERCIIEQRVTWIGAILIVMARQRQRAAGACRHPRGYVDPGTVRRADFWQHIQIDMLERVILLRTGDLLNFVASIGRFGLSMVDPHAALQNASTTVGKEAPASNRV